jgi:hypothetical protein
VEEVEGREVAPQTNAVDLGQETFRKQCNIFIFLSSNDILTLCSGGMAGAPFCYGAPGVPVSISQGLHNQYPVYMNFPHFPVVPATDSEVLKNMILAQVEYYLSVENLIRDIYLRKHMDKDGFLTIDFIASFNRIKNLTMDVKAVKEALLESSTLELDSESLRVRPRDNPGYWVLSSDELESLTDDNISLAHATSEDKQSVAVNALSQILKEASISNANDPTTLLDDENSVAESHQVQG